MVIADRLHAKVRETVERFPWYCEYMNGVSPESIRDIQELPLMTADKLESHYYHAELDGSLSVYRTSGTSSGRRKAIRYSLEDDNAYIDIKVKLFGELLEGTAFTRAAADLGTGHAASTAASIFNRLGLDCLSIPFELPIERHVEQLLAYKPEVLYTMPSILEHLALAAEDPRDFGIQTILLVGEIAAPEWQQRMAQRFGLKAEQIIDTYGSIEIGTIASYSHKLGRYLITEGLYAEGISLEEAGIAAEPLAADECILTLTSFIRNQLPAVRFVTYDVVRGLRPLFVDGVPRMSFQAIVKRVGPELKHGEKISLYDIERAVHRHVQDAVARVHVGSNRLTVRIHSRTANEQTLEAVRADLRSQIPEIGSMIRNGLLDDIQVELLPIGEAPARTSVKNKKLYIEKGDG